MTIFVSLGEGMLNVSRRDINIPILCLHLILMFPLPTKYIWPVVWRWWQNIFQNIQDIFVSRYIWSAVWQGVTATRPPFGPIPQYFLLSWIYTQFSWYNLGGICFDIFFLSVNLLTNIFLLYINNLVLPFTIVCKAVSPERRKWVGNSFLFFCVFSLFNCCSFV